MCKWVKRIAVALAAMAALGVTAVYVLSEMRLARTYDTPVATFDASAHAFSLQEAERRAKSLMCTSCHARGGGVIFEAKYVGRLVAPNLPVRAKDYSDGELERLVRHGVKRDSTGVIAMPAATYAHLADEDLAAIIRYLRSLKAEPDAAGTTEWGPLGRLALALGKIPYEADHLPSVSRSKTRPDNLGAYLVGATCLHCHDIGRERDNGFGMKTPPLAMMAASYGFDEFRELMRTGIGKGNRDLGLMTEVSRQDFAHFTDAEMKAIHDYLVSKAE